MELGKLLIEYGLEAVLISLIAIALVGVVKIVFKSKLEGMNKSNRKIIYEVVSTIAVFGLVAVWMLISKADFKEYTAVAGATYVTMKVMYPLYENYRLRDLVQLIGKILLEPKDKGE